MVRSKWFFPIPFSIFFSISLLIQFGTLWLIGYDAYFHIKFSFLLKKDLFIENLPWLWYTIYREEFRDHHFLFHYLLIPFTFGDLIFWGKIAAALFMALAWFTFYKILQAAKVQMALFWSLIGFLSSHTFLFRLSMLRIQSLALAFILILFYFHMTKNFIAILIFSFIFAHLYDGFPLAVVISFCFTIADFLINRKLEYRYIPSSSGGIFLGLVINPYFPDNIASFIFNIHRTIFFKEEGIKLGIEWYPYTTWFLLENMLLAFIAFVILFLFLPFVRNIKPEGYASLMLSLFFLILLFKSRRFIEYTPAFLMLSFILIVIRNLHKKYGILLIALFTPIALLHLFESRKEVRKTPSPIKYRGAALWLKKNSNKGDIVFNADWDDFPFLFFYNHKNYYIVGLDPMYMYKYDKKLYRLYQMITRGKVMTPSRFIKNKFKAKYIFTDKMHKKFIRVLKMDKGVKKVYEDKFSIVYKIIK